MKELTNIRSPADFERLWQETEKADFSMASDKLAGSLIRSLIAAKPGGRFLDMGTGTGLSLSWMVDGMDEGSKVISVDNDQTLIDIAGTFFGDDPRVELICTDGRKWIESYGGPEFDLIFADAWPGKYSGLDRILSLVRVGGIYLIDDMLPQSNWPDNHRQKAKALIATLENRKDFHMTKMNWSTGVILLTRK